MCRWGLHSHFMFFRVFKRVFWAYISVSFRGFWTCISVSFGLLRILWGWHFRVFQVFVFWACSCVSFRFSTVLRVAFLCLSGFRGSFGVAFPCLLGFKGLLGFHFRVFLLWRLSGFWGSFRFLRVLWTFSGFKFWGSFGMYSRASQGFEWPLGLHSSVFSGFWTSSGLYSRACQILRARKLGQNKVRWYCSSEYKLPKR